MHLPSRTETGIFAFRTQCTILYREKLGSLMTIACMDAELDLYIIITHLPPPDPPSCPFPPLLPSPLILLPRSSYTGCVHCMLLFHFFVSKGGLHWKCVGS